MKITVFGAVGSVGSRVVAEALSRGHEVTAVVRDLARFGELPSGDTPRVGDASDAEDVARLSEGQDVVVGATRPAVGSEGELATTARALLSGVSRTGARLLLVGGAGSLVVPGTGGILVIDTPKFMPAAYRAIAQACSDQLEACRAEAQVDWAYLSPPALLLPGQRTVRYRLGADELLLDAQGNSSISVEYLAVALLDEAEQPKYHRVRFTVTY